MEGASGQPDAGREFVQLLNTIRDKVEPRITVLLDLGIVNIYHLDFSLPGWNLPFGDMAVGVSFQDAIVDGWGPLLRLIRRRAAISVAMNSGVAASGWLLTLRFRS